MMRAIKIIEKKRDKKALSTEEIRFFVNGFVRGGIPDYQVAAWLMAVYLNGMTRRETVDLTLAMAESGDVLDLSSVVDFAVDKHSSGGVGDKTTLVVLPLVVACDVPVGKMTGRGLSFSGGTVDKMESIRGYRADLTTEQFLEQLGRVGIVLTGQSADLAPADGTLYALRDVTGTVQSMPLIASSIMSKKLAAGADGIVLDVKVGAGAFMQTVDEARKLAHLMVDIGLEAGRKMTALISDMNQPLGCAVGNALEVREAIETLRGGGPPDFVEHCIVVAGHMLRLAGVSRQVDLSDVQPMLEEKLANGEALEMFRRLVRAQGGDVSQVDDPDRLPRARVVREVAAPRDGYLAGLDAREVGLAAVDLGAGRTRKGDPIDHAVGIVVHRKVGEQVSVGEPLFAIHANDEAKADAAQARVLAAHSWSDGPVEALSPFYAVIAPSH
jgi:pyrimidine-nucleoside phosphorylase